jgi:small basic protein
MMYDFELSAFDESVSVLEGILQSISMGFLGVELGFDSFVDAILVIEALLETRH